MSRDLITDLINNYCTGEGVVLFPIDKSTPQERPVDYAVLWCKFDNWGNEWRKNLLFWLKQIKLNGKLIINIENPNVSTMDLNEIKNLKVNKVINLLTSVCNNVQILNSGSEVILICDVK